MPYYQYKPLSVLENSAAKLYWDRPILTDRTIPANRPDIVLVDHSKNTTYIVDVTIPHDENLQKAERDKILKYMDLAHEIKDTRMWRTPTTIVVPIVISTNGLIPKSLHANLCKVGVDGGLKYLMQKAVLLSTCRTLQLDLDYLERREAGLGGATISRSKQPPPEASPDSLDLVKVVVLGAHNVGKTSIIQQFVWNDFTDEYFPTDRKHTFYPSVIINDHLYEVKISDIPVIPYFPVNSYYEWTDFRFYGLRNATAYILVFDLANIETFQYIKMIREQIYESRDMRNVPFLVVGNKQDLLCSSGSNATASGSTGALQQLALPSTSGTNSLLYTHNADYRDKRRDIVNLVKKHWKCGYVECSAKFNWRVVAVFKELMKTIDAMENTQSCKDRDAGTPMMDNFHEALEGNRCVIF